MTDMQFLCTHRQKKPPPVPRFGIGRFYLCRRNIHSSKFAAVWCVKVCRQRWYMLAGGLAYPQPRIYALDRIIDLETTDHRFTLPPDFDAEAYFRHSFGIVVNEKYLPETVKLKVYDERVCYLRTLPLHQSQTETESGENYAVFNYFLSPTNDFQHKLLSIGESVEVLEPQWLRHEICRAARKTVQRNK
ncbi:MAG: WYL domain-containing protein [Paludibacteraceae bacterium]